MGVGAVGLPLFQTRCKHIPVSSTTPVQGVDGLEQGQANGASLAMCN